MLGTYTNFVNLMNLCAITVPTAPRTDGRPGSVTLIAKAGQDARTAAIATRIEALGNRHLGATNWALSPVSLSDAPPEDMIRIAVCGAHMEGLPLNHTLTDRGARYVRSDRTAPDYRFYALPGAGVARPGLVRTGAGEGGCVALELWDVPVAAFGGFMKTIPAPLGIGTLTLADGAAVQGFLCEAVAAQGARDITDMGDWRRFLAQPQTG